MKIKWSKKAKKYLREVKKLNDKMREKHNKHSKPLVGGIISNLDPNFPDNIPKGKPIDITLDDTTLSLIHI